MWEALKNEVSRTISGTSAGATGPGGRTTEISFMCGIVKCGADREKWRKSIDESYRYYTDQYREEELVDPKSITKILSCKYIEEEYIEKTLKLIEDPDIGNMLMFINAGEKELLYKAVAIWRLRENIAGVSGIQDDRLSDPTDAEKGFSNEII